MLHARIGFLVILPVLLAAVTPIAHLANVRINAAKVDASGNIYVVGQLTPAAGPAAAYIGRLNPDGTSSYATTIGGSGSSTSSATVLDIDSTGAVYVAGTTTAADFPVTAGAVRTIGATAFAAKLDAKGNVVYTALIAGNANTQPRSIVINSRKEAVISGQLSTGSGATFAQAVFLVKLSADGTQVVPGLPGIGGLVTADAQDNIYVAGFPPAGAIHPAPTPGAFQGLPATSFCGCPFVNFACGSDQFVASLTPDLSQTRFLTYLTARHGAAPAYLALDARGNILVAGTTSAPGYPTTPASYQPNYTADSGTVLTCGPPIPLEFTSPSGYVTLLKPDGSGLVFSSFFSGSKNDTVSFAALTPAGIYLAGQAGSPDLPGFDGAVPSPCVPVGFVAHMTLDGSAISSTHTPPGTPLAYDSTTGTLLLASGSDLLRFDPTQSTPIACVLDAADLNPVTSVAPGELLTMFGRFLYFQSSPYGTTVTPANGSFPTKFQGLSIAAGQTPAPLLYVAEPQINFQVPYETAAAPRTSLTITYSDFNGNQASDSRTFPVAGSNPAVFLSQPATPFQSLPLALNANGTPNSLNNPAAANSVVTMFLDGLGATNPLPITGLINTGPPVSLNLPIVVAPDCSGSFCYPAPAFLSAASLPGSISGVTQVQLRAPANPHPGNAALVQFSLSVGSTPVRNAHLTLWVN